MAIGDAQKRCLRLAIGKFHGSAGRRIGAPWWNRYTACLARRRHAGPRFRRIEQASALRGIVLRQQYIQRNINEIRIAEIHLAIRGGVGALDLHTQLVVSLGAGIYEELLFRVVLVGALMWGTRRLLGAGTGLAATVSVVVSALIFSGFHYVGALGDTFTVASFTFRAIAGVAFSVLYVTRGFGVTAWTHALYDLGISLLQT